MTPAAVLAATAPVTEVGAGETALFVVVAPLVVLASLGLLFGRKAVHTAIGLAVVMIGLAFIYVAQDAPFLGVVQIVVYTGAVMMLFLFVLMLVGIDSGDSLVETIRGQRIAGFAFGAGLLALLVGALSRDTLPAPAGLAAANADTNPVGVARVIFGDYVFAFEATGGLLITAALGAIVLTHSQRLAPRTTQAELSRQRVAANQRVTPLPPPGVFARHNAVDTPALLPDGRPAEISVSRVLSVRGQNKSVGPVSDDVTELVASMQATADGDGRAVTGNAGPASEGREA